MKKDVVVIKEWWIWSQCRGKVRHSFILFYLERWGSMRVSNVMINYKNIWGPMYVEGKNIGEPIIDHCFLLCHLAFSISKLWIDATRLIWYANQLQTYRGQIFMWRDCHKFQAIVHIHSDSVPICMSSWQYVSSWVLLMFLSFLVK